MKKIIQVGLLLIIMLQSNLHAQIGPTGQNAALYTITFDEEFNGSNLNTSIWNNHLPWYPNDPMTNYAVENGALKIWPVSSFKERDICTNNKFYQTYGFFEFEAKLMIGKGCWPGLWLYNDFGNRPPMAPEIDIMEAYPGGGTTSGWGDVNLHPIAFESTVWIDGNSTPQQMGGSKMIKTTDLSAAFHQYGLKWEKNKQTFYFDGQQVYTLNVSMPDSMFIIIDLAFGDASGQPNSTTPLGKTNSLEVNYVRAWKFGSSTNVVEENSNQVIIVYPSPAKEFFTIQFDAPVKEFVHMELINLLGQKIIIEDLAPGTQTKHINVQSVPAGIYSLALFNGETIMTKKTMIIH